MASPFTYTEEELRMLQPDYKKPKVKKWFGVAKRDQAERNSLHERGTVATRNKQRMSKEVAEFL